MEFLLILSECRLIFLNGGNSCSLRDSGIGQLRESFSDISWQELRDHTECMGPTSQLYDGYRESLDFARKQAFLGQTGAVAWRTEYISDSHIRARGLYSL